MAMKNGAQCQVTCEYPLFTDARIVAEGTHGPYVFLNTVPIKEPGQLTASIVLRCGHYLPFVTNIDWSTTDTKLALMYFCGLRPGEARAARWEDYNGKTLRIRASMWRTHLTEPKTTESSASVPIAETLAAILNESRQDAGYILAGPSGKPTNLHNLARRVVAPSLRKAGIPWHGWYALRRGIATLATSVETPLAAKGLLRHANLATTQAHYIKDVPSETVRAMEKIDALCNNAVAAADRLQ